MNILRLHNMKRISDQMLFDYYDREFCNPHKHCHYSNVMAIDSVAKPIDFINRAIELNHTTVFSTQHGVTLGYHEYYDLIGDVNKLIKDIVKNLDNEEELNKIRQTEFQEKDKSIFLVGKLIENIQNNIEYKIHYRFGVEIYFTTDELNNAMYHLLLLARNRKGFDDINKIVSHCALDGKEGSYRNKRPKVTLNQILTLDKKDVVVTTACLGGYIGRLGNVKKQPKIDIFKREGEILTESVEVQTEFVEKYTDMDLSLIFKEHFGDSFFIEMQNHNTDKQKQYNIKALEISRRLDINLIAGIDSHAINLEQVKMRDDYIRAKGITYEDEDGWHLDYPSYGESIERFKQQGVLSNEEIISSMENTRICLDFEEITYENKKMKIPTIYPDLSMDERNQKYLDIIYSKWNEYKKGIDKDKWEEYEREIKFETDIITSTNVADYFLFNYELIKRSVERGGIITKTGRGCFLPDTKVLTCNGYKDISSIDIGDIVINKNKEFDFVEDILKYTINEEIAQISSWGNKDIQVTKDHKIYTCMYNEISNSFIYKYKKAEDIINSDFLVTPIPKTPKENINTLIDLSKYAKNEFFTDNNFVFESLVGNNNIDINNERVTYENSTKYIIEALKISPVTLLKYKNNELDNKNESYKKIFNLTNMSPQELSSFHKRPMCWKVNRFIFRDYDFMFFLGFFLGDGCINKTKKGCVTLYMQKEGSKKDELAFPIIMRFIKNNGFRYSILETKNKNMVSVNILSTTLVSLLNEMKVYDNNAEKNINIKKTISENNIENLKGLYYGLLYSDGSIDNETVTERHVFDNKSNNLNAMFNILCFIIMNTPTSRTLDKRYNATKTRTLRMHFFVDKKNGYIITKVKKVNFIKYEGDVYDLTIKNDPSFVVENAIVHNSASSFLTNFFLGFTNIDRLKAQVKLYPTRFLTAERILSGSIPDIDYNIYGRDIFIEVQKELLGYDNAYWMIALNRLKAKSAFKVYAKSQKVDFAISNKITSYLDEYESDLLHYVADEDDEDVGLNVYDYIPKEYHAIYDESLRFQGIIDAASPHACGFLLLNGSLSESVGLMKIKDEVVAVIEGRVADKWGYVKNDLLSVSVWGIIGKTFERIGKPIMTVEELLNETRFDEKVWEVYKDGYTMGINQMEQDASKSKLVKYVPSNISEVTAFTAAVRPGFKSMFNLFLNRQEFSYDIKVIDDLIQTDEMPYSFLLYQEQVMSILNYSGIPETETYDVIKAISKKKIKVINAAKEHFINGLVEKLTSTYSITEKDATTKADMMWKIVEDSSRYSSLGRAK